MEIKRAISLDKTSSHFEVFISWTRRWLLDYNGVIHRLLTEYFMNNILVNFLLI